MLARMPAAEITEWTAYEQVTGPLGGQRADLLAGILAATIANTFSRRRFAPADFVPAWDRPEQQPWQTGLAIVKALNRQMGGTTIEAKAV